MRGYVQGMHAHWLARQARAALRRGRSGRTRSSIETRFRYNPDVRSLRGHGAGGDPAAADADPGDAGALSVVREKELGSIVNLYVTPVTRLEFLLGKQIPYVVLAMLNFLLLTALAVTVFGVPLKGSFLALTCAALLYVIAATGIGPADLDLHAQPDRRHLRHRTDLTIIPAIQFSGMIDPVSSLEGARRADRTDLSDHLFPDDLPAAPSPRRSASPTCRASFVPLLIAVPVLIGLSAAAAEEAGELTMRAANILHLGVKELRSLARDPMMLVLIVYAFTFSIYTAATAMPETLNKAPIAIVDEDHSPLSARIVDAFYPPYFMPPG